MVKISFTLEYKLSVFLSYSFAPPNVARFISHLQRWRLLQNLVHNGHLSISMNLSMYCIVY